MAAPILGLKTTAGVRESVEPCITLCVTITDTSRGYSFFHFSKFTYTGTLTVDWGDGTIDSLQAHQYQTAGEKIIKIRGSISAIDGGDGSSAIMHNGITKAVFNSPVEMQIGQRAISSTSLSELTFGKNVTRTGIAEYVEYGGYVAINSSDSLNVRFLCDKCELGPQAFSFNGNVLYPPLHVKSVNIPNGCTSIPKECFKFSQISEIRIPEGVTTIGEGAFYKCLLLQSVVFPSTTTIISGGDTLSEIWVYARSVPTLLRPFASISKIHVRSGMIGQYTSVASPNWPASSDKYRDDL